MNKADLYLDLKPFQCRQNEHHLLSSGQMKVHGRDLKNWILCCKLHHTFMWIKFTIIVSLYNVEKWFIWKSISSMFFIWSPPAIKKFIKAWGKLLLHHKVMWNSISGKWKIGKFKNFYNSNCYFSKKYCSYKKKVWFLTVTFAPFLTTDSWQLLKMVQMYKNK